MTSTRGQWPVSITGAEAAARRVLSKGGGRLLTAAGAGNREPETQHKLGSGLREFAGRAEVERFPKRSLSTPQPGVCRPKQLPG